MPSPSSSSLLGSALYRAAEFTAKGAMITFGSTLVSCTAACYIERGAHQLVYHYFPHKYANVEWANGLTQEQLDAVRHYRTTSTQQQEEEAQQKAETMIVMHDDNMNDDDNTNNVLEHQPGELLWEAAHALSNVETTATVTENSYNKRPEQEQQQQRSSTTQFWKDLRQDKQQQQETTKSITERVANLVSLNEIQACAMTG